MAGVTQVAGSAEGHVFHNRLTHSLKVAQLAKRLAEKFQAVPGAEIDPDVVEAAALAHDLGHPPFGHIAEKELDRLAREKGEPDGFEGNAQSFRVLVKLSASRQGHEGLNWSRASLAAVLKYPWLRELYFEDEKRFRKFGAYRADVADLRFALGIDDDDETNPIAPPCLEAEVMDKADDIAYSVHDLEDFWRAGLIPGGLLALSEDSFDGVLAAWARDRPWAATDIAQHRDNLYRLTVALFRGRRFDGSFKNRAHVRRVTSGLTSQYFDAVRLRNLGDRFVIETSKDVEVQLNYLQWLVWAYVILRPRLATQQTGQRQIIAHLFETYLGAIESAKPDIIPPRFDRHFHLAMQTGGVGSSERKRAGIRLAVDIVAGFTDAEAVAMFRRLSGYEAGSVMDMLHG